MGKGDRYRPVDIKVWDDNYEKIFGHNKPQGTVDRLHSEKLKYKPDVSDNPHYSDLVKVGNEINKYKQLDKPTPKMINEKFGYDANKHFEKKIDKTLVKNISREISQQIASLKRRLS